MINIIFWIEKQYKNEYVDSAKYDGIRCRFADNLNEQTKKEIKEIIDFIRKKYYFPIRLNITFFDATHFIGEADGHKYYGVFYDGENGKKTIYPKISIPARITEENSAEDILFNIAHEITHYYQWYFLEDTKRTGRSLEIEANKWAYHISDMYSC